VYVDREIATGHSNVVNVTVSHLVHVAKQMYSN